MPHLALESVPSLHWHGQPQPPAASTAHPPHAIRRDDAELLRVATTTSSELLGGSRVRAVARATRDTEDRRAQRLLEEPPSNGSGPEPKVCAGVLTAK